MDAVEYAAKLDTITSDARFLAHLDVLDVQFRSGHHMELYVANTPDQRRRGLANLASIDSDGMLFYYPRPTYTPFTMKDMCFDLDIAWFGADGTLLDVQSFEAGYDRPVVTWRDFSYVIEAPRGHIPYSDMVVA